MGEEDKAVERGALKPYQVNAKADGEDGKGYHHLHALPPGRKGNEVTEDVFEQRPPWYFDEAENRMPPSRQ